MDYSVKKYIGKSLPDNTEDIGQFMRKIMDISGAKQIQIVEEGIAVAGDFRNNRATIQIDRAKIIRSIRCG